MYPDLSYFFHDFFGTPVDNWMSIFKTFGFFLVMAIIAGASLFRLELKRKAEEGLFKGAEKTIVEGKAPRFQDLISNLIFGFLLGFKLPYIAANFDFFRVNPGGALFSLKGNLLLGLAGAAMLATLKWWDMKRKQLPTPQERTIKIYPHDRIGDLTLIAGIFGVFGAKLFTVIEDLPAFFADPVGMLLSGSGLTIYGGLILGFVATYLYLGYFKIPQVHVMDAVAPALIVGYGVGRMGCHFSGDGDWGIPNNNPTPSWWFLPDWVWAYDYPRNVLREGVDIEACVGIYCKRLAEAVYPTSVYEIVMAFSIGLLLWLLRKRIKIAGMLFFLYVLLNGLERFLIEKIRVNIRYESYWNMTQAELIAIVLMLIGLGGMIYLGLRARRSALSIADKLP